MSIIAVMLLTALAFGLIILVVPILIQDKALYIAEAAAVDAT